MSAWSQPPVIMNDIGRREFLIGLAAAATLLVGCGGDEPAGSSGTTTTGPSAWEFTDDRGQRVSLPQRPERVAAYVGTAAALWDLGIRATGVFGTQRQADGTPVPAAGRLDLDVVKSLGEESVDLEALAALRPDLIVMQSGPSGLDPWPVTKEQVDEVARIAPIVAAQGYGAPVSEIVAGYERLAAALGADMQSADLEQARGDLTRAAGEFRAAAAAKPGLVALFTYADNEGLWVAKIEDYPDLLEFQRLGLAIVKAGGPDDYWEMLSWEQAGRYPADVIFHDERPHSLQPDALRRFPTWTALPAVRAGQVYRWNAETVLSHRGFAAALSELAGHVRAARANVV
jgi:iron complex transport system substrate-binding protein